MPTSPNPFARHIAALRHHLESAPFLARLRMIDPDGFDADTMAAVIEEAGRFAAQTLDPINATLDREGCRLVDGRVVTSQAQRRAWGAFVAAGWPSLSLPVAIGGQGLPLLVQSACDEVFNRASPAFTMLPTPGRTAAILLAECADQATRAEWLPHLASGRFAATICISEPGAGSDVGRVTTRAERAPGATDPLAWRVTGEKCWISFGDHDLASRIGHCLIARTSSLPGLRGLSLFLVPDTKADGTRNAITLRRIEEKMGLHGSPTCALGFDRAEATLLGEPGRGLQQLFTMVLRMRLSVGAQGAGVATGALHAATAYVQERRQGGPADRPAPPIAAHADVQRQILVLAGRTELVRGLSLATAAAMDLSERDPDPAERTKMLDLVQFLLPIVKEQGARCGFEVASEAIQLLGGAGYTRDFAVEQGARDARVFSIFEGTSGMQALDMLHRRLWRDDGAALAIFLSLAEAEMQGADPQAAAILHGVLGHLKSVSATLDGWRHRARDAEAGAIHYLNLCGIAASGWIALRLLARADPANAAARRSAAAARASLADMLPRAAIEASLATRGAARLAGFDDVLDD